MSSWKPSPKTSDNLLACCEKNTQKYCSDAEIWLFEKFWSKIILIINLSIIRIMRQIFFILAGMMPLEGLHLF